MCWSTSIANVNVHTIIFRFVQQMANQMKIECLWIYVRCTLGIATLKKVSDTIIAVSIAIWRERKKSTQERYITFYNPCHTFDCVALNWCVFLFICFSRIFFVFVIVSFYFFLFHFQNIGERETISARIIMNMWTMHGSTHINQLKSQNHLFNMDDHKSNNLYHLLFCHIRLL